MSFFESLLPWPFEQLHVCRTVTVEGRLFSATSTILSALAEEQAPSAMLSLPVLLNLDTSTAATPLRSRLKPNSRVTPPISMLCLWNSRQKTQKKKYNDDGYLKFQALAQRVLLGFLLSPRFVDGHNVTTSDATSLPPVGCEHQDDPVIHRHILTAIIFHQTAMSETLNSADR
jgi:hypothetical protein